MGVTEIVRTRTLPSAAALAVLFSSAALAASAPALAAGDASLKSVGDLIVDATHQRIYVSDPTSGHIGLADFTGRLTASVADLPGVDGLAMSPDNKLVYAAVPGKHEIVAIDVDNANKVTTYPAGDTVEPRSVAVAAGKIWFGYTVAGKGNIGSLDLTGATPVVALDQDANAWAAAPKLASTPGSPNLLAAADSTAAGLSVFDLTTGKANRTARNDTGNGPTKDLAFAADGKSVITAGAGNAHTIWQTSDLKSIGSYPSAAGANAIAVAANGTVAAGAEVTDGPAIYVFKPGTTKSVRQLGLANADDTTDTLATAGLAWDPTGRNLFAATRNTDGEYGLRVIADATKSVAALTVSVPGTAPRAKALTVTGKLTGDPALAAGTPLSVARIDAESPTGKSLGTKKLGAKGVFSFSDTPLAGGKVTYKVTYKGDANHTAVTKTATVKVNMDATTLSITGGGKTYAYGTKAPFTVRLGKSFKNRTVEVWADPAGTDKPKTLVSKGKVNASGVYTARYSMTRNTAITAVFAGDTRTAAKSAKVSAAARAKVVTTISGAYRKAKIGSDLYYFIHSDHAMSINTTMSMYPGREFLPAVQADAGNGWVSGPAASFIPLASDGTFRDPIKANADIPQGIHLRFRASYIKGHKGDNVNATTNGNWVYFVYTK